MPFADRREAGTRLAGALAHLAGQGIVVLALPRGGVPVAAAIAARLEAPLDLLLVRKIGLPWQPELAMGAVVDAAPAITVRNDEVISQSGVSAAEFERVRTREVEEIERRRLRYLRGRPHPAITGLTVILVDDGIATGATVRAAVAGLRQRRPARIVLAVPVAPPDTIEMLRRDVDELVCLESPRRFGAIGQFYADFSQVSDEEVIALLDEASGRLRPRPST